MTITIKIVASCHSLSVSPSGGKRDRSLLNNTIKARHSVSPGPDAVHCGEFPQELDRGELYPGRRIVGSPHGD